MKFTFLCLDKQRVLQEVLEDGLDVKDVDLTGMGKDEDQNKLRHTCSICL